MSLRSRLAIAFAATAVVPLALVVPLAHQNLQKTLSSEMTERANSAEAAASASLRQMGSEIQRAIEELADSAAVEEIAKDLWAGSASSLASDAERLMKSRRLTVLSLFDAAGKTLSCGHLPARLGDRDEALFSAAKSPGAPTFVLVEILDATGVRKAPALVAASPMDYGDMRLWVVGGRLLDQEVANSLSHLTGSAVEISAPDAISVAAGSAAPPLEERVVPLGPARLAVRLSRATLLDVQRGIIRAVALQAAVGLGLAMLLGWLIARRITRPLETLTQAARRLGTGEMDLQVAPTASGEIGELMQSFNRMIVDLKEATERLRRSERIAAWQEVARRLAHEIKNPLTPIKMSLETLKAAHDSGDARFSALFQEGSGAVLEEVERLRRIVDEFSRFARLPRPELADLNLGELADRAVYLFSAVPQGIAVDKQLESDVWVRADRDQISQVLLNLLKNAMEAVDGKGSVLVRVYRDSGASILEVKDSGPGISPEDLPRIFEPYFSTKPGGTGLGLAIAARICEEHGARLQVRNAPGGGAIFQVVLPTRESASP